MNPFFLPLPIPLPMPMESHVTLQVEQYLDVALCLLRRTAERLRDAVGPEALEPELLRFLDGNDPIAQSAIVSQLDALVKQKKHTEAVRRMREMLLVTWDQAFDLYDCWPNWDHGKKLRCLQAAELRKLFAALNDSLV